MEENMMESILTELIVNGGGARSKALEAVKAAKSMQMDKAEELLKECNELITKAHHFQTSLIQSTMNDENEIAPSLLLVHGQDHLMDAMVVRDLALEMIDMYKLIYSIKNKD